MELLQTLLALIQEYLLLYEQWLKLMDKKKKVHFRELNVIVPPLAEYLTVSHAVP